MTTGAWRFSSDLPIRKKLLISYLAFISVPLLIFSTVSYLTVAPYYEDQFWFSANQSFDQAFTFISTKISALVKASDIIYLSSEIQSAMGREETKYREDISQQYADMLSLDNYLAGFRNSGDVYRMTLYVADWLFYADQNINFSSLARLRADPRYAPVFESGTKVVWYPAEEVVDETDFRRNVRVLPMYRKLRDYDNLPDTIGVIKVVMLESVIVDILAKSSATRSGIVYIRNSRGETVCVRAEDRGLVESLGASTDTTEATIAAGTLSRPTQIRTESVRASRTSGSGGWRSFSGGGQRYFMNFRAFPDSDWSLVSITPASAIQYRSARLRDLMAFLFVAIGLAAYSCAVLITRSATKRLSALADAMDRVRDDRFPIELPVGSRDEIGQLTGSFNYMGRQLALLLEARYKAGQELKSAELRALQAQINPHFLSNTLELINWKAINKGAPEIAEISRALARFYALSLNSGRDVVPLEDELFHVETYVKIQNMRFEDRIGLDVDVPQELRRLGVLKLILQPLVENSILHGILERGENASGRIGISARCEGPVLVVEVSDDGVGMSHELYIDIFRRNADEQRHGYGVRNINDRLKLHYGEDYGLEYRSGSGQGTTVTVRLPATPFDQEGEFRS